MKVLDTSSIIFAWDNYPPTQFPGLWDWMADLINEKMLAIPKVAIIEVGHKTPECEKWLKVHNITILDAGTVIILEAMRIKKLIGIKEDNYSSNGVDENDLFIIATAKIYNIELISNEERQIKLPLNSTKYKIPAVCSMDGVGVKCSSFIDFFKQSGKIFR